MTGEGVRLSTAQRARALRNVLLALSRFGPRVHRVSVGVSEQANPLGGLDRCCRMQAWLRAGDTTGIGVEVINGQIGAAVGRAATGLAARLTTVLDGVPGRIAHASSGDGSCGSVPLSPGTPAAPRSRPPPHPRRRRRAR